MGQNLTVLSFWTTAQFIIIIIIITHTDIGGNIKRGGREIDQTEDNR